MVEAKIENYQCPSCGGPLEYDAESAKLHCPYCESNFNPEDIAIQHSQANASQSSTWDTSSINNDWGQESSNLIEYSCPSCCGTIVCDKTTAASSCPYCNNPTILETQFKGNLKPDYIIPFNIKKEKAIESLKYFYKGKPLLPKTFTSENKLKEIKGVYVPFWLFDGTALGQASFTAERTYTKSNSRKTIEITKHYECRRAGEVSFKMVPVDASVQMDDNLMDSIEPYDYSGIKSFSTGFLPGYMADIHDVNVEDCFVRAERRCTTTCIDALEDTVRGYDSVNLQNENIYLQKGKVHYSLFPVYILNTLFNDKKYTFAINGQTGKTVGELPISKAKGFMRFFISFLITLIIEVGAMALYLYSGNDMPSADDMPLVVGVGLFIALVIATCSLGIAHSKMKTIFQARDADNYINKGLKLSFSKDIFLYETERVIERREPDSKKQMGF